MRKHEHPKIVHSFVNRRTLFIFAAKMIVIFGKPYLKLLYTTGASTEKKHRFQPDITKRYIKVVNTMIAVKDIGDLSRINSLRYEKLSGDKKSTSSIRISDKYRLEFEEIHKDGEVYATICQLTELSNHYK